MSLFNRNGTFHYDFIHKGKRYQGSTGEDDRARALIVEDEAKRNLGKNPRWVRSESAEPGIYFLQSPSTKLVKVGCSGNLGKRIKDYDTHSAESLYLLAKIPAVDYREAEKEMHEFLKQFHVRGEWYRISSRHIEAAVGYWMMGHKAFGGNKKIMGQIEPDLTLDTPPHSPCPPKLDKYGWPEDSEASS